VFAQGRLRAGRPLSLMLFCPDLMWLLVLLALDGDLAQVGGVGVVGARLANPVRAERQQRYPDRPAALRPSPRLRPDKPAFAERLRPDKPGTTDDSRLAWRRRPDFIDAFNLEWKETDPNGTSFG